MENDTKKVVECNFPTSLAHEIDYVIYGARKLKAIFHANKIESLDLQDRRRDAEQQENNRQQDDDHILVILQELCRLFTAVAGCDFGARQEARRLHSHLSI